MHRKLGSLRVAALLVRKSFSDTIGFQVPGAAHRQQKLRRSHPQRLRDIFAEVSVLAYSRIASTSPQT